MKLKQNKTYFINYPGFHGYDAYCGLGKFTGKTEVIDVECYEFEIDDGSKAFFPLENIISVHKKFKPTAL